MKQNYFEAISSIKELNDEDAATFSGGIAYTGSNNPDVILYRDVDFNNTNLTVNASQGDGLRNLGNDFNDLTSSIVIIRGTWAFYRDVDFTTFQTILEPGLYSVPPSGIANDSLSSLFRIA